MIERKSDKKERVGDYRFTFNGNMIVELGEESISNHNIALAELIKNSYDADSASVFLEFVDLEKHNTSIKISDDGEGMNLSDIKDKFMDIGSPHKKGATRTKELNRVPVGAKGIGRFASHSLGNHLFLSTGTKGEKNGYELDFDWKKFSPNNKATDINIETSKFDKKASVHGTTLQIKELKNNWNDDEKIKSLMRDIELLVSPIDPPKKFKIKENITNGETKTVKIRKEFFNKAVYSFKAKLTKKKNFNFEFYKLGKLIKKQKTEIPKNLSCGDTTFELFFYYKTTESWKRNTGADVSKKDLDYIRSVLDEYGGIKIYRDHFRVKPYGDPKADWIGLDKWARDDTNIPRNIQTLGIVTITKEKNPKIEDTTTREGVINNIEYYDLVQFVTTSIREFAILKKSQEGGRVRGKNKNKKTKTIRLEKPKAESTLSLARQPLLIGVNGSFPSTHYDQIIHEANECNEKNYPNAALWLCRKIIENLVTHILEKKFKTQPNLWYDVSRRRVIDFSQLIVNLYDNRAVFTKPGVKHQIEIFNGDITPLRKAMNSKVHNNYDYMTDRSDLKKFKIKKVVQTLVDIYSKI